MVSQRAADQEFQRQVIAASPARLVARNIGIHPVRHQVVAQRPGQRLIGVKRRTLRHAPEVVELITLDIMDERCAGFRQRLQGDATGGGSFLVWHGSSR
jgi:hypothetical protein